MNFSFHLFDYQQLANFN